MAVIAASLYRRAFGSLFAPWDARRTSYHIDKLRPRLSPFGQLIRTVIDHGYMLLREPQEPRAARGQWRSYTWRQRIGA